MNIHSTNTQSVGSSNSANRSFGQQRQDAHLQARGVGTERDPGTGHGNRGYGSNPDYLRARYATNSGSHRFRIG